MLDARLLIAHGVTPDSHPDGTAYVFVAAGAAVLLAALGWWARSKHLAKISSRSARRKREVAMIDRASARVAAIATVLALVGAVVVGYGVVLLRGTVAEAAPDPTEAPPSHVADPDPDARYPIEFLVARANGVFKASIGNRTNEDALVQCTISPLSASGDLLTIRTFEAVDRNGNLHQVDAYTNILQVQAGAEATLDVELPVGDDVARWEGSCIKLRKLPPEWQITEEKKSG